MRTRNFLFRLAVVGTLCAVVSTLSHLVPISVSSVVDSRLIDQFNKLGESRFADGPLKNKICWNWKNRSVNQLVFDLLCARDGQWEKK